jgi:hypothetical protein
MTELLLAVWCLLSSTAQAAPSAPAPVPGGVESELQGRLFFEKGNWSLLSETALGIQTDERRLLRGQIGGYYTPDDHLKIGVFYRKVYGIRHDEDWVSENGIWKWRDTRARGEDNWLFDLTPRMEILESTALTLVGELKSRFIYNTTLQHRTLLLRPGMNAFFFTRDGQARLAGFLQFEFNFALGRGGRVIPEKWLYLGVLKPLSPSFELGLQTALKWESWGAPGHYLARGGTPYLIDTTTLNLGLLVIYRIN